MATGGTEEGKTMEASSSICDACETNAPVKYCEECTMHLCTICTKAHQKIGPTKNHILKDLKLTSPGSIEGEGQCSKHDDQKLDLICKECMVLICSLCKPNHPGHTVEEVDNDPQVFHRLCTRQIQNLIDEFNEIEDVKRILEGHIDSYDNSIVELDKWELELLNKVKKKASELRGKIKKLKDERLQQLTDKVNGLMVQLQMIDSKITELSAIRKSMDCEILSQEIASAQALIANLESYKLSLTPLSEKLKLSDILPNASKMNGIMNNIDYDLDILFQEGVYQLIPSYGSVSITEQLEIVGRDPHVTNRYHICNSESNNQIIFHGYQTDDIQILNTRTGTFEKKKSNIKIGKMIAVGDSQYVGIDSEWSNLYLSDGMFSFHKVTAIQENDIHLYSLCYVKPGQLVIYEVTDDSQNGKHGVIITIMQIFGNTVTPGISTKVQLKGNPMFMAIHNYNKNVTLCSSALLYKIELRTGDFTSHDITRQVKEVTCCLVDLAENTLVGDSAGNIHLYDKTYNHNVIKQVDGSVQDMMISQGNLIVLTSKNKILIYA